MCYLLCWDEEACRGGKEKQERSIDPEREEEGNEQAHGAQRLRVVGFGEEKDGGKR